MTDPFRWGLSASSVEVEGLVPAADWTLRPATWPTSPGWDRWLDEFSDSAPRPLTDVRITLEWARIEPTMERPDLGVVEHLHDLLGELRSRHLRVWATLHHGSLPGWFAVDEHGFADKRSRTFSWPRHVESCGEWFGDLVDVWVPIDAPIRWATATQPPQPDFEGRHLELVRDTLRAELAAARILTGGSGLVATAHELRPRADDISWCWTRALAEGVIDVPGLAYMEEPDYATVFDILGVTFRTPESDGVGPLSEAIERAADSVPDLPIVVVGHGLETAHDNEFAEWAEQTADQIDDLVADGLPIEGWFAGRPLTHPTRTPHSRGGSRRR
ncbi:MAG: family 1 glycosylhydrolase [Actinomycetia bacterium]|nr:family 1 glycosylhydrolase [Actinomycetes bacterium]